MTLIKSVMLYIIDKVIEFANWNSIFTKIRNKENLMNKKFEYEAKTEELKNYKQVNEWANKNIKNNINKIINK